MIPCAKSELLIFDETPVQTSLTSSSWVDFHSISNTASGGPIEFFIPGSQDEYLDLNDTKLYLQVRIEPTPADSVVAPANLMLSTLFKDVSIKLNETTIQGGEQLYAYKAMIETMLLFDKGVKKTQLRASGYVHDQAGQHEIVGNTGFINRVTWTSAAKMMELLGPLHLDIMTQSKYLIPLVDVRINLTRHSSDFALMSQKNNVKCKINIEKAILFVRKVSVLPSVLHGHELGLQTNNAQYPIQHVAMQTFTVASGQMSINRENIFQGRMPKFICVCMVENAAYSGDFKRNPYNFQHFDITFCGLYRDGECIPERMPYDLADGMVRPYMGMIHALEQFNRNETNGITLDEYKSGSTFFVFNLTPDLVVGSGCQQAYRSGNIRLELKFRNGLARPINVIIYGVFDGKIEITKERLIHLDYL